MQQSDLKKLLNNESLIRWLKGEAIIREQRNWDQWLEDHPQQRTTIEKARKIVTMPFVENMPSDTEKELCVLRNKIAKVKK
jgi:hypothetical protein